MITETTTVVPQHKEHLQHVPYALTVTRPDEKGSWPRITISHAVPSWSWRVTKANEIFLRSVRPIKGMDWGPQIENLRNIVGISLPGSSYSC